MERPDPCQLTGIKYSLIECNRCRPIMFQEHHLFSAGPGTEIRPRSSDLYSMTAGDIIRMLEISDHQTDEVHINRHTRPDSCRFWSFEERPRHYLIILDSIYTIPLDVFSSFLSTFVFPELPGLTPSRRSSNWRPLAIRRVTFSLSFTFFLLLTRIVFLVDTSRRTPHQICSTPWGSLHHHPSCHHDLQHINDLPNQVAVHHLLTGNLACSIDAHNSHHPLSMDVYQARPIWAPSADFTASRNRYFEERRRERIRREKRLENWGIKSTNIISFNYQEGTSPSHRRRLVRDSTGRFSRFVPKFSHWKVRIKQWLQMITEEHQLWREEPVKTFDKQF
jgi:hypothetical protein